MNQQAETEFRTAKGWRTFIYIGCTAIILLFLWLVAQLFIPGKEHTLAGILIIVISSIVMLLFGIFGIVDTIRSKFVITSDRVYSTAELSDRELLLTEIRGYHHNEKYIFIEPLPEVKKKRIRISMYYGRTEEIINWLDERYPDLKREEAQKEAVEILTEADYGLTPEQRVERLKKAKQVSRTLNIAGIVASAWLVVFPRPLEIAVASCILLPIISIAVLKRFGGLIRIDKEDKSPYPSVFLSWTIPSLVLMYYAIVKYDFVSIGPLLTLAGIVTALFTISMLLTMRKTEWKKPKNWWLAVAVAMVMFTYGYGTVATVNAIGDQSGVKTFKVNVVDKRISPGKSVTYYLRLEPWGPIRTSEEVDVPKLLYNMVENGDEVQVHLRQGMFNLPWYKVTE